MLSVYLRHDFPSLGSFRSYLDTARVGLMPSIARDEAVRRLIEYHANPLAKIEEALWRYEHLKKGLARLLGASSQRNITLMGSTTSCIARSVGSILVSRLASDRIPLRVAVTIHGYPGVARAVKSLCRSLRGACADFSIVGRSGSPGWEEDAIEWFDEAPGVLVASSVEWVTGYVPRLESVAVAARKADGFLVVDGAQQTGHIPLDLSGIGLDVLCTTSRKWLLNPLSGLGIGYVSDRLIRSIEPYIVGQHNVKADPSGLCDPAGPRLVDELRDDADRFMSISRPTVFSIDVANIVVEYLLSISPDAVKDHVLALRKILEDLAVDKKLGVALADENFDRKSGIALIETGLPPAKTMEVCKALSRRGVAVSCRGQAGFHGIRASMHIYNNEADIQVFIDELARAMR